MSTTEFETIVKELSPMLYRFAYSRVQRDDLAKDVVQECLVKLWNEQKPLTHYLSIKAYCLTMVKNKSIDFLRAEKTRRGYENENNFVEIGTIDLQLERDEKLKIMNHILDKLNAKQAIVLKLRDFEGYSYKEIAHETNETESNIKVLLHRGRKALKNVLNKHNEIQQVTY